MFLKVVGKRETLTLRGANPPTNALRNIRSKQEHTRPKAFVV